MEGSGLTQVNDQYNTQVMHCKIKICGQFDLSIELEVSNTSERVQL